MLLDGFTVPGSMLAPWAVRRKHEMTTRTSLENMVIFGYFFRNAVGFSWDFLR